MNPEFSDQSMALKMPSLNSPDHNLGRAKVLSTSYVPRVRIVNVRTPAPVPAFITPYDTGVISSATRRHAQLRILRTILAVLVF